MDAAQLLQCHMNDCKLAGTSHQAQITTDRKETRIDNFLLIIDFATNKNWSRVQRTSRNRDQERNSHHCLDWYESRLPPLQWYKPWYSPRRNIWWASWVYDQLKLSIKEIAWVVKRELNARECQNNVLYPSPLSLSRLGTLMMLSKNSSKTLPVYKHGRWWRTNSRSLYEGLLAKFSQVRWDSVRLAWYRSDCVVILTSGVSWEKYASTGKSLQ